MFKTIKFGASKSKNAIKSKGASKRMMHEFGSKNPFSRNGMSFAKSKLSKLVPKRKASSSSKFIQFDKMANGVPKSALITVGVLSGIGIAALAAYGATTSTEMETYQGTQITNMYGIQIRSEPEVARGTYTSELRKKIGSAYGYFAGSLAMTAASAYMFARSPMAFRIHQNPWLFLAVGGVGTIAAMIGTQMISYHQNPLLKHVAWAAFTGLEGLTMAPIAVLGGPLIMNAVIATGCIVGSISLLTAVAPSDAWRQYSGVFGLGLGCLMGASIGLLFFPGSSLLYNFMLYGGLLLHGWGVFRGTGRIIEHANHVPITRFDPINESISLYIHTLGIFIRMVMMMSGNNRKK